MTDEPESKRSYVDRALDDLERALSGSSEEDEDLEEDINWFEEGTRAAIHDIREDLGRQLGIATNKHSSHITVIGILIAFSSVLLIAVLPESRYAWSDLSEILASVAFLLCCLFGFFAILRWKKEDHATGGHISRAIEHFNERNMFSVQTELLDGLDASYSTVMDSNDKLGKWILYMVSFIIAGLVVTVAGKMSWEFLIG